MIPTLFRKAESVPITFRDLGRRAWNGCYSITTDTIVLDKQFKNMLPICKIIVYLHEMFHSTGSIKRTMRFSRLKEHLPQFSFQTEEVIAELACMVAMKKLGILTKTSKIIPELGITNHYKPGMYIPWREVVSTVNYFLEDGQDLSTELAAIREYATSVLKLDIRDTYIVTKAA